MKNVIPAAVVFIIVAILALIFVKEGKRGNSPQTATTTETSSNYPKATIVTVSQDSRFGEEAGFEQDDNHSTNALNNEDVISKRLVSLLGEVLGGKGLGFSLDDDSDEQEEYYPESLKSIGSVGVDTVIEGFYGENLIAQFEFTDDNPQWRSIADASITSFASEALGRDLSVDTVNHLRGVLAGFVERNIAEVFNTDNGQAKSGPELEAQLIKAIKEANQVLNLELNSDLRDLSEYFSDEVYNEIVRAIET